MSGEGLLHIHRRMRYLENIIAGLEERLYEMREERGQLLREIEELKLMLQKKT